MTNCSGKVAVLLAGPTAQDGFSFAAEVKEVSADGLSTDFCCRNSLSRNYSIFYPKQRRRPAKLVPAKTTKLQPRT